MVSDPAQPASPSQEAELIPLRHLQLYERIRGHLIDWIREGRFEAGDRLPAERELALRLGVSRSSVREAIGSLQIEEVLETRPGAGSFVAANALERLRGPVIDSATAAPSSSDAGPFAVLEARRALEPSVVRAAAGRTGQGTRAIELLEQMEMSLDPTDPVARGRWSEADRLFHRELAVMSENPVFVSLGEEIARLMDQPLWRRLRDDLISVPGRTVSHVAEHRLIYQDIVEGDAEAAAIQAENHVRRVERQMSSD